MHILHIVDVGHTPLLIIAWKTLHSIDCGTPSSGMGTFCHRHANLSDWHAHVFRWQVQHIAHNLPGTHDRNPSIRAPETCYIQSLLRKDQRYIIKYTHKKKTPRMVPARVQSPTLSNVSHAKIQYSTRANIISQLIELYKQKT